MDSVLFLFLRAIFSFVYSLSAYGMKVVLRACKCVLRRFFCFLFYSGVSLSLKVCYFSLTRACVCDIEYFYIVVIFLYYGTIFFIVIFYIVLSLYLLRKPY